MILKTRKKFVRVSFFRHHMKSPVVHQNQSAKTHPFYNKNKKAEKHHKRKHSLLKMRTIIQIRRIGVKSWPKTFKTETVWNLINLRVKLLLLIKIYKLPRSNLHLVMKWLLWISIVILMKFMIHKKCQQIKKRKHLYWIKTKSLKNNIMRTWKSLGYHLVQSFNCINLRLQVINNVIAPKF